VIYKTEEVKTGWAAVLARPPSRDAGESVAVVEILALHSRAPL